MLNIKCHVEFKSFMLSKSGNKIKVKTHIMQEAFKRRGSFSILFIVQTARLTKDVMSTDTT